MLPSARCTATLLTTTDQQNSCPEASRKICHNNTSEASRPFTPLPLGLLQLHQSLLRPLLLNTSTPSCWPLCRSRACEMGSQSFETNPKAHVNSVLRMRGHTTTVCLLTDYSAYSREIRSRTVAPGCCGYGCMSSLTQLPPMLIPEPGQPGSGS